MFHFVFGCDYDNLINIAVGYHSACFASLLRHSIFLMKIQVSNKNPKGACKYHLSSLGGGSEAMLILLIYGGVQNLG